MSIKEFLNQAFYLDRLIQANKDELERLRLTAESILIPDISAERVQGSKKQDKIASTVAKIIDLEQKIQTESDCYIQTRTNIRCLIEGVCESKLKLILQERYLNFKKWEQIQEIVKTADLRYLFRLHNMALEEVKRQANYHCITM